MRRERVSQDRRFQIQDLSPASHQARVLCEVDHLLRRLSLKERVPLQEAEDAAADEEEDADAVVEIVAAS